MDSFSAYVKFLAIKRHFAPASTYDYHKYNGKVTARVSSFEARSDRFLYEKLAKHNDLEGFLVANISQDPKVWVGNLREPAAEANYLRWCKVTESITRETENALSRFDDFNEAFEFRNGTHPPVITAIMDGQPIEVFAVLERMLNFTKRWHSHEWDPNVKGISHVLKKLGGFVQYDDAAIRKVVVKMFSPAKS